MASIEESSANVEHRYEPKKFWRVRKKTIYIVLFVILAPAIPIFTWLFNEMHAAGKALDGFSQKLIAKDYDGAYSAASPEFQAAISKQDFVKQQMTLCSKLGALKAVTRGGTETKFNSSGGFTTVDTTFTFQNAEREFTFKLKKVGESWRVYGYEEE